MTDYTKEITEHLRSGHFRKTEFYIIWLLTEVTQLRKRITILEEELLHIKRDLF